MRAYTSKEWTTQKLILTSSSTKMFHLLRIMFGTRCTSQELTLQSINTQQDSVFFFGGGGNIACAVHTFISHFRRLLFFFSLFQRLRFKILKQLLRFVSLRLFRSDRTSKQLMRLSSHNRDRKRVKQFIWCAKGSSTFKLVLSFSELLIVQID